ncbi:hypothetical protein D9M70_469990 [compost metagenome]
MGVVLFCLMTPYDRIMRQIALILQASEVDLCRGHGDIFTSQVTAEKKEVRTDGITSAENPAQQCHTTSGPYEKLTVFLRNLP